ncbi:peroxiredoxin Q/BCP [Tumebacillus sp. BK434]|uniref:peroxiredoxin n=1 Tax=Tumebacillus sp. BK434 TaxID=2512169 RepID=UPI00104FDB26|nr:redoxin domain-containing protein [Tumebacillus sp. BK434]TCP53891.1 peroxiredoxin Q/BCP [Tumebacillus sp. BK434]
MLEIGATAPDFQAESTEGPIHLYDDYKGKKNVILIFYPINNTPGCRKQLCEARDAAPDYEKLDTVVLGINPGKFEGHMKFTAKHNFGFPLVFDDRWKIIAEYGVPTFSGMMVSRCVLILDKDMNLRYFNKGMPSTAELTAELEKINQA